MKIKKLLSRLMLGVNLVVLSSAMSFAAQGVELNANTGSAPDTFWVIILAISLFSTCGSLWIAYKFYVWRTNIDLTGALVPEQWARHISNLSDASNKFRDVLGNQIHESKEQYNHFLTSQRDTACGIDGILEKLKVTQDMLLNFQATIDTKDAEISRLKKGYDNQILRKNILAIVNLHIQIMAILAKDPENKSLRNVEFLLRDEVENFGVEIRSVPIGEDFAKLSEYIDVVGHTSKTNANLAKGQISEVVSDIYLIRDGDQFDVLRKAKIKYHLPLEDSND